MDVPPVLGLHFEDVCRVQGFRVHFQKIFRGSETFKIFYLGISFLTSNYTQLVTRYNYVQKYLNYFIFSFCKISL